MLSKVYETILNYREDLQNARFHAMHTVLPIPHSLL